MLELVLMNIPVEVDAVVKVFIQVTDAHLKDGKPVKVPRVHSFSWPETWTWSQGRELLEVVDHVKKNFRLSDFPKLITEQFKQLQEVRTRERTSKEVHVIVAHPQIFHQIWLDSRGAPMIQLSSHTFERFEHPIVSLSTDDKRTGAVAKTCTKRSKLKLEQGEKVEWGKPVGPCSRLITQSICMTNWPKTVLCPTNEADFLNRFNMSVNVSKLNTQVFQLTMPDLFDLTQLVYSTLFVANLTTFAKEVVVMLPKKHYKQSEDGYSLADIFFASVGTHILGTGNVTLYQWNKKVKNFETALKLNMNSVTPGKVVVIVGSPTDFTPSCIQTIKKFKFQHYSYIWG